MNDPRTQLVADWYDAIGERFAVLREQIVGDPRREWEDGLASRFRLTGAETFFSSSPPEENSRLVREAGFEPIRDEAVTFDEPEGPASFQWVLARA